MKKYFKIIILPVVLFTALFSCAPQKKDPVKIQIIVTGGSSLDGYYIVNGSRAIWLNETSSNIDLQNLKITTNGLQYANGHPYFEAVIEDLEEVIVSADRLGVCAETLKIFIYKNNTEAKSVKLDSSTTCTSNTLDLTYTYGEEDTTTTTTTTRSEDLEPLSE